MNVTASQHQIVAGKIADTLAAGGRDRVPVEVEDVALDLRPRTLEDIYAVPKLALVLVVMDEVVMDADDFRVEQLVRWGEQVARCGRCRMRAGGCCLRLSWPLLDS